VSPFLIFRSLAWIGKFRAARILKAARIARKSYFNAFAINVDTSFFNSASEESWIYIMCPAP
jgi:hypothetical protein